MVTRASRVKLFNSTIFTSSSAKRVEHPQTVKKLATLGFYQGCLVLTEKQACHRARQLWATCTQANCCSFLKVHKVKAKPPWQCSVLENVFAGVAVAFSNQELCWWWLCNGILPRDASAWCSRACCSSSRASMSSILFLLLCSSCARHVVPSTTASATQVSGQNIKLAVGQSG